jgi:23S rRNA (guanosine2251-2'-O)-methyltransferase
MRNRSFEIRVCSACGLRYPLTEGHSFGERCPHCLGETQIVLQKKISVEQGSRKSRGQRKDQRLAVLADNIRSAWNVGSILRSADGFGFDHAYLCGITPTPENEAVKKTSLGAEDHVTWSYHKDAVKLVNDLKKDKWEILALEEEPRAIKLGQAKKPTHNTVLIIGSEISGIDAEILDLADQILCIPMRGEKRSFNAANAFSIAAYAVVEQIC